MVECELIYHKSIFADSKVLIDTWWNVNRLIYKKANVEVTVLIDTWWNVN